MTAIKIAVTLGCVCAVFAGIFADFGMGWTATAFAFITIACGVFCGAEWETGKK